MTQDQTGALPPEPRTVEMQVLGPMRWTNHALDTYVAPYFSTLGALPVLDRADIAEKSKGWCRLFMLRGVLLQSTSHAQKYMFLFVRRSAAAIRSYEAARAATAEFVQHFSYTMPPLSRYAIAMDFWDIFIAQAYQAVECLYELAAIGRKNVFKKDERELFERCYALYNAGKHPYGAVVDGMPQAETMFTVWLQEDGLHCRAGNITWAEAAELVDGLSEHVMELDKELQSAWQPSSPAE